MRRYNKFKKRDSASDTNQCLAQPSSETLPPAADGGKHRDPQADVLQRVRGLEMLGTTS